MVKLYVTAPSTAIVPVLTEDVSTETKEVEKLSSDQLTTISNQSGIDVKTDSDLIKAKEKVLSKLNSALASARSIKDKAWETVTSIDTTVVTEPLSNIPGVSELKLTLSDNTLLSTKQALANLACPDLTWPDLNLDFLNLKINFEGLLDWAINIGDYSFLSNLFDCVLFDIQSINQVKTYITGAIDKGDVSFIKTILPVIDTSLLPNKKTLGLKLATKMENTAANVTDLKAILTEIDVTPTELMKTSVMGSTATDISAINKLSPLFVTDTIGTTNSKILLSVSSVV